MISSYREGLLFSFRPTRAHLIFPEAYVKTIVTRYKDSPTIFAWELMNEARCLSDTLPAGPSCVPGSNTLRTWYQEQSNYVRSLYVNRFNITHHDRLIHTCQQRSQPFDHDWRRGTLLLEESKEIVRPVVIESALLSLPLQLVQPHPCQRLQLQWRRYANSSHVHEELLSFGGSWGRL